MRKHRFALTAAIVLVLLAAVAAGDARAQVKGIDDPEYDPLTNPKPFDPRYEVREYFRQRMPTDWWASDPIYATSIFTITIFLPDRWRGNPTSAVAQLCPDRHSTLWQEDLERILVHPFHRKRPWPSIECRR
ncbi:hypothetical protein EDC65_0029 [Stella humosa]|uniref:Uncharacterized protein n=1 Tax=Stella humosa TaxID=94 RepID=A0A3N1MKK9_9PROT|nr:hypothetical protein [Stella humosa]ROQ03347.1 hypothetical protein EDC65_0029 [Stella humosa]BBK29634.1 hypothetical protein STHU_02680 [Stella humosa]